jgi:hypothetical protein
MIIFVSDNNGLFEEREWRREKAGKKKAPPVRSDLSIL